MSKFNLIYLKNKVLISKKEYLDWREIQNDFNSYVSSLEFASTEEIKEFLKDEYSLTEEKSILEIKKY